MKLCSLHRIAIALLLLASTPALALTEVTETLPSGAHIRIAVPDGWSPAAGLILYQHGFNMAFDNDPDLGPIRELQLADGWAIAASGYRGTGWALFNTVQDNQELLTRFKQRFGTPTRIVTMGGSMGGLIAHQLAENPRFETVRGVYSLCPPAAGTRTWDSAFDLRMAYDAICEGVGGGELPNGAQPFPWAYNLDDIPEDIGDLLGDAAFGQTIARINQCTGIALNSHLRTPPQRERLQRLMQFGAFTSEDFLLTNLAYSTFAMSDLLRAPDKLNNANPFTSVGVDYGSALIQSRVAEIRNDPLARVQFRQSSDLFGTIDAEVRMVSLHTSRDELVRPAHQQFLRDTYAPSQLLSAIVEEDVASHCGFTLAEVSAGWKTLNNALAVGAPSPRFEDLVAQCQAAVSGGIDGPCRFEVSSEPGAVAETMRPRATQGPNTDIAALNISGSWYDPERSGEGLLIEHLAGDQALVVWFTYPPQGQGEQSWLVGVGTVQGSGISVDGLQKVVGARFGPAFNPDDVVRSDWGDLQIAFDVSPDTSLPAGYPLSSQIQLTMTYQGPADWGNSRRAMRQLVEIGVNPSIAALQLADTRPWQHSGTYYDPARSGEGVLVQQFRAGENSWQTLATWFTFDTSGKPMWLLGVGSALDDVVELDLVRPIGTHFGADFLASEVVRMPWGHARLHFDGCDRLQLNWQAIDSAYGTGTLDAQRLSTPTSVKPCR